MSPPEPHANQPSDPPGLEVVEGPRPGTPKIEQSYYDPHESPSFAKPQPGEHTYWFGAPAPPLQLPLGRALYRRLTGLFNALLPRFFATGPAQPLLPLSAGLTELGAQDASLFRAYNSCFFSLLHIFSFFSWK